MATFILSDICIKKVEKPGNNKGKEFIFAMMRPKNDIFGRSRKFTSFEPTAVQMYKQFLPVSKGGVAQQEQPIPEELKYVTGIFADYIPVQKFHKIHLSDHEAGSKMLNGQLVQTPAIKAGEKVSSNGIPIIYTTLRVFCRQMFDDTENKYVYAEGESPEEVGFRAYQAYCIPIQENNIPQDVEDPYAPHVTVNQGKQPVQPPTQPPYQQMPPQGVI